MIANGEGREAKIRRRWHYLAVKKTIRIIKRNKGDFYCLNYLHSFATEKRLNSHKKSK